MGDFDRAGRGVVSAACLEKVIISNVSGMEFQLEIGIGIGMFSRNILLKF